MAPPPLGWDDPDVTSDAGHPELLKSSRLQTPGLAVRNLYIPFGQPGSASAGAPRGLLKELADSGRRVSRSGDEPVANSVPNTQPSSSKLLIVNDLPFKSRFGQLSPHSSSCREMR